MTTPGDPQALLRSRSYTALLVLAAVLGLPATAVAVGVRGGGRKGRGLALHLLAQGSGLPGGAAVVAPAAPHGGRTAGRAHDPLPAGERRSLTRRRVQGEGRSDADRASRGHLRGPG